MPLLAKAGIVEMLDEGCLQLDSGETAAEFITKCRNLRYWQRAS